MALWVDKHRPRKLDQLTYHDTLTKQISTLVASKQLPHLMFYGPTGSGRKTRISCLLRELYGPNVEKVRVEHKSFKLPSRQDRLEIVTLASSYHVEMSPADAGYYDRVVVQEVIKEMAQSRPLDLSVASFKVLVLNDVDQLSKLAQNALRRTMEKYMSACRLILCCNSQSKVIEPLRSRCLCMRVAAPSEQEVCDALMRVAKAERLKLDEELARKIATASQRNVRRAILQLEAMKVQKGELNKDQPVTKADWESFIEFVAEEILREQSPQMLLATRAKLYELLGHCIPPTVILRTLTFHLLKRVDARLKHEIVSFASHYEHRMQLGAKPIFHLEAFIAKFMAIFKRFVISIK